MPSRVGSALPYLTYTEQSSYLKLPMKFVSASYSMTIDDSFVMQTNGTVATTITLPAASACPQQMFIIKAPSSFASGITMTINTAGGNIDGAASVSVGTALAVTRVVSDGTNYWII